MIGTNGMVSVPIRVIDTITSKEIRLMTVPVSKRQFELELASWLGLAWVLRGGMSLGLQSEKGDNAWRCDPHSVWSKDYKWIALNGMPDGRSRQVLIAYVGDIHRLFHYPNKQ